MTNLWTNQEWHSPDGRTVYIKPDERPCIVTVHFKGGERPRDFPFDLGSREIDYMTTSVDESRYVREPHRDWDDEVLYE